MKRVFYSLLVLAIVLASVAVGLRLTPYVAVSLGYSPYRFVTVEGSAVPPALVEVIDAARESVVVYAETVDNRSILDAIYAAGARGASVVVVMSSAANPSPTKGGRAYLQAKGIPHRVVDGERGGLIVVVDRRCVVQSASPLLSSQAWGRTKAHVTVVDHAPTAAAFFDLIQGWVQGAS